MIIRLSILILLLSFLTSCSRGSCSHILFMAFENSIGTDIEIQFRSDNIYYKQAPVTHLVNLIANESVDIELQSLEIRSYTSEDCEDTYANREIEISNESLSMYTFCRSGLFSYDSQKIRISKVSSSCLENESQILTGY